MCFEITNNKEKKTKKMRKTRMASENKTKQHDEVR
jgi:hypothetical protein